MLIEHGASLAEKSNDGTTPIFAACRNNQINTLHMLIAQGASLSAKTINGYTPLHEVCCLGIFDVAVMLIEQGSNLTDTDENGHRPIDLAITYEHVALASLLKEKFICAGVHCLMPPKSQCSRCMRAFYCSKNCQVVDWRRHKKSCRKTKA